MDPSRIYATYFGGDESTPADEEAKNIWLKYLPVRRTALAARPPALPPSRVVVLTDLPSLRVF